jgi:hypothetical protein
MCLYGVVERDALFVDLSNGQDVTQGFTSVLHDIAKRGIQQRRVQY